jgi:hypothetical protein
VTDTQISIPDRGPKKAKPVSAGLPAKPGCSAKLGRPVAPTIDLNLIPPAAQLRLSAQHPCKRHTDYELHRKRNTRYQDESRERRAHKRESSIAGMVVKDPVSIVPLQLSEFEKKQVIEASSPVALSKHGYDAKKILTPREDSVFIAALAKDLLFDLLMQRLKGRKKP